VLETISTVSATGAAEAISGKKLKLS